MKRLPEHDFEIALSDLIPIRGFATCYERNDNGLISSTRENVLKCTLFATYHTATIYHLSRPFLESIISS